MSISRLAIHRPVTTLMAFLALILLGLISWSRLPQELFPSIAYPQITVVTSYPNAAPEEIENLITKIIEESVGTVNNVKRISSISREGLSLVMVEFNWGTNMDFAALNVREKIDLIKERIPRESQEPVVMKYNPFDLPIMNLAVTGPYSSLELREMSRKYIKDGIEKVEGVASAVITGGDEREILVEIDQPRLRVSQISIVSVVDSIKSANINYPAGTLKENFYEYLIRTMGEYQKVSEIAETPTALEVPEETAETLQQKEKLEKKARRLVFLKDIARVRDSVKETSSISRYNGKGSISIVVRKQSGSNALKVAQGIRREITKLQQEKLPKGVNIQVTYDQSHFINEAVSNVTGSALQGALLAFLVLLFFLRELKSSLVITFSIPISIMTTLFLMYCFKINMNMMSLGGLALGIGMLVDNSIVVIENIFRHRQMNKTFKEACVEASEEMLAPIIGSTLTTVAVFLPFAFVSGIAGQIFKQLSLTITFALTASILVAITLVPVLISFSIWRRDNRAAAEPRQRNIPVFDKLEEVIVWGIDRKEKVVALAGVLFVISLGILLIQEKQFMPKVDQRQFIIKIDMPPGTTLKATDVIVRRFETALLGFKETQGVTVNIGSSEDKNSLEETAVQTLGSHQAQILVNLKKKARTLPFLPSGMRSTDEIIQQLKNTAEKGGLEGASVEYVAQETSLGSAVEQGAPIAIEIKGPQIYRLTDIAAGLQSDLRKIRGIYGIKNSMPAASPETKLHILKDKASLYGLSVRDIAVTAQVALKGYVATKFKDKTNQEDIDIRIRLRPEDRSELSNLRRILIHSPLGFDISMSDVAYLTKGTGPTEIKRIDQQRSIVISANVYKRGIGDVNRAIDKIIALRTASLPKEYAIELAGEQQKMQESFQSLAFALILAITLVYMIMAAEFESLWQPLLIMFTVPLSLIGVAFFLFITNTPLSVVAYLGIIMLGGIAVNNGIVLIEFINDQYKQGYSPYNCVIEASKTRMRPILMTSLTTILGLLPLALGIGEGAELQAPMALTVMGGLLSATFLTLVVIPSIFLIVMERMSGMPAGRTGPAPVKDEPLISPELEALLKAREEHKEQTPLPQAACPPEEQPSSGQAQRPVINDSKKRIPFEEVPVPAAHRLPPITPSTAYQPDKPSSEAAPAQGQPGGQGILPAAPSFSKENAGISPILPRNESVKPPQENKEIPSKTPADNTPVLQTEKKSPPEQIKEEKKDQAKPFPVSKPELPPEEKTPPLPRPAFVKQEPPREAKVETPPPPVMEYNINPRQKDLLERLKNIKKITRKEYAEMFNVSIPTAARDLKELMDKQLLKAEGPLGPGRWYEPV